jgi:hypothetical protein
MSKDLDATPERLARANNAGRVCQKNEIYTPAGMPTGSSRREILSVLDSLFHVEPQLIEEDEWEAGNHFLRLMHRANACSAVTMQWLAHVDGGRSKYEQPDFKQPLRNEVAKARRAVRPMARPALLWLEENETEDMGLAQLGAQYPGGSTANEQAKRGRTVLRFALGDLSHHFGFR